MPGSLYRTRSRPKRRGLMTEALRCEARCCDVVESGPREQGSAYRRDRRDAVRYVEAAAGFGSALAKMAARDAICRDASMSFPDAALADLFGLAAEPHRTPGVLTTFLCIFQPAAGVLFPHAVGHDAPLHADKIDSRPGDGRPVALSEIMCNTGINAVEFKFRDPDLQQFI